MVLSRVFSAASLAVIATASPLQLLARQNASSPCAQVSASVATQASAATPTVAAKLAYDCITSVPLNQTAAVKLLDGIVPYFRWQSNTAWLKDPPAEYAEKVQPAVDIWVGLEDVRSKVEGGEYENEFDVGLHVPSQRPILTVVVRLRALQVAPVHPRWAFRLRSRLCRRHLQLRATSSSRLCIGRWKGAPETLCLCRCFSRVLQERIVYSFGHHQDQWRGRVGLSRKLGAVWITSRSRRFVQQCLLPAC